MSNLAIEHALGVLALSVNWSLRDGQADVYARGLAALDRDVALLARGVLAMQGQFERWPPLSKLHEALQGWLKTHRTHSRLGPRLLADAAHREARAAGDFRRGEPRPAWLSKTGHTCWDVADYWEQILADRDRLPESDRREGVRFLRKALSGSLVAIIEQANDKSQGSH